MKLLVIFIVIIQPAVSMSMLNSSDAKSDQVKHAMIYEKTQLNQLNDAYEFLAFSLASDTKNFLVSPFFKNRCGELYSLIVNEKFKSIIEHNLKRIGFYEYFDLFSVRETSVLSSVDFILTRNYPAELSTNEIRLLIKKGVTIGNRLLKEDLENKKYRDIAITKILDNFRKKFNSNTLKYTRYLKVEHNKDILYKFISVANFIAPWENEFQGYSYKSFSLSDDAVVETHFMQNIVTTVLVDNSYGLAYRLFCKNKQYVLDIFLPLIHHKDIDGVPTGYLIDLIFKLNAAQNKKKYREYIISIPRFEFKQFNNNITPYFQKSLLNSFSIDKGINFINISDIKKSIVLQDINIKVDKMGININAIEEKATEKLTIDIDKIEKEKKHTINRPFFFMVSELDYGLVDCLIIKKIIALGKIHNPNIVE